MERLPDLAGLTHAEKDALIHALMNLVTALRQEVVRLAAEVTRMQDKTALYAALQAVQATRT
jgi:hypothetical protein